jgi:signal peptidase I
MLYLGKGRRASVYLMAYPVAWTLTIGLAALSLWPHFLPRWESLQRLVTYIGVIDSILLARQLDYSSKWYSRRPAVTGVALVWLTTSLLLHLHFGVYRIPGNGMFPSLRNGDHVLVNRYIYGIQMPFVEKRITHGSSPKRGDVVVFYFPPDPRLVFMQRVVGVPGDQLTYRDKILHVNGRQAEQTVSVDLQALDSNPEMNQAEIRIAPGLPPALLPV